MGRLLRRNKDNFNNILKKYFVFKNETKSLEPLKDIFNSIVQEDFEVFLAYLKNNPEICDNFGYYIRNLLTENLSTCLLLKPISFRRMPFILN